MVDTSVWIDHFRQGNADLQALLSGENVVIHSAVIGELACGNLHRRSQVISDLTKLLPAVVSDLEETLFVIESRKLWGKGIGWTDAQLLASALLSGCKLWSHEKQLRNVAASLGIGY